MQSGTREYGVPPGRLPVIYLCAWERNLRTFRPHSRVECFLPSLYPVRLKRQSAHSRSACRSGARSLLGKQVAPRSYAGYVYSFGAVGTNCLY